MAVLTAIAIGTMVAGAALRAKAAHDEGKAAERAGQAQQTVAESAAALTDYNAQVADLKAKDALERGAEEESRFRASVRDMVGKQRTGFAGANIDVGFGSAADVQADTAYLGELDARTIRVNAMREAWGFQVEGVDLRERARITRMEGDEALKSGKARKGAAYWNMAGDLVGAGGSLLLQQYGMRQTSSGGGGPVVDGRYSGMPSAGGPNHT